MKRFTVLLLALLCASVAHADGYKGTGNYNSVPSASTVDAGIVELATSAETTTGTDADKAVTPDALAGSNLGKRGGAVQIVAKGDAVSVGDEATFAPVTSFLNGQNISNIICNVETKGVTGATSIQVIRRRDGVSATVLSTPVTIGDEWFAQDGAIDTSYDDLATGDSLDFTVTAIHSGTAPNGLNCAFECNLP